MRQFRKIIVNGKEVDPGQMGELPEAVRQVLVDQNNNGIPDMLEGILDNPLVRKAMERAGYQSFEQIPPEMREKLQKLMSQLGGVSGASPNVQVQTFSMKSGASAPQPVAAPDWKQGYSLEEPKSISAKTVVFAMVAIFAFLVVAFIAWLTLTGK